MFIAAKTREAAGEKFRGSLRRKVAPRPSTENLRSTHRRRRHTG